MKQAERRKYHYIYKITRTDGSGKYYIGMHSTDNLDDGYFGSGKLLWKSINKHGKEKHNKEILEQLNSRSELKAREKEIVNLECLADKKCMNLQLGGGGGISSEEHAEKLRTLAKISGPLRLIEYKLSRTPVEAREAGKKAAKTRLSNGPHNWVGQLHSEETKQKMRKPKNQGEKNSQFGTCWVTNGIKPSKIKKEQLDEYLFNGYSRGRIFRE